MSGPHPRRARWSVSAVVAALIGGALLGWALRATPVTALITAAAVTTTIIGVAEVVRRQATRDTLSDTSIDREWRRGARSRARFRWPVSMIAVALVTGGLAGLVTYLAGLDGIGEGARRHRTTAIIVEPVGISRIGPQAALGRWKAPDGTLRTGRIPGSPSLPAGTQQPIWTDQHGALTQPPPPTPPTSGTRRPWPPSPPRPPPP